MQHIVSNPGPLNSHTIFLKLYLGQFKIICNLLLQSQVLYSNSRNSHRLLNPHSPRILWPGNDTFNRCFLPDHLTKKTFFIKIKTLSRYAIIIEIAEIIYKMQSSNNFCNLSDLFHLMKNKYNIGLY